MEFDEYDYKLSRNSSTLIANVMSSIIQAVNKKLGTNVKEKFTCIDTAEFKYLKQKCLSGDSSLCCAAGETIVHLIKSHNLEISKMMSDVTAMIPFAQNHRGLLIILIELLIMDLEIKLATGDYKCPFNLNLSQHPIVTVLVQNIDIWSDVLNHIKRLYRINDAKYQKSLNELFRPVFLYIICEPFMKVPELCKTKFLKFLLEEEKLRLLLITDIICWLQISTIESQIYASYVLLEVFNSVYMKGNKELEELALFWLLSLLYEMCVNKTDPSEIIFVLRNVECFTNFRYLNIALILLAKCLNVVQPQHLSEILILVLKVLADQNVNKIVLSVLKASLINWLLYQSILLEDSTPLLHKLFNKIDDLLKNDTIRSEEHDENSYLTTLRYTNQHLYLIFELDRLLRGDAEKNVLPYLYSAENFSNFLLKHTITFISGTFLYATDDCRITLQSLLLLLKLAMSYNQASNNILTLFLYKLSNTRLSIVHFEILKGMVRLGNAKENLNIIVNTLATLSETSPQMKTTSLSLYHELWKSEPKCYVFLQKLLIDDNEFDRNNFFVAKSYIIMELCKSKPELYGSELATYISKVLNSCKIHGDGVATSLALDGLTHLCTKGIIDITTAWRTLEPSFSSETRSNVLISFCRLLSEFPNLYVETPKFDKMMDEVVKKLWDYILNSADTKVMEAAYEALPNFSVDEIRRGFANSYESASATEDLDLWYILMLQINIYRCPDATENFLASCVAKEVSEFGKGIYYVLESKTEPSSYAYLPSKCIVKGLMAHVKRNYNARTPFEVACFKILSRKYSKPLPPLDWCFLQEYVHYPEFREGAISIACHQVVLSGTARRFMENFISAITENLNNEDLTIVLSKLKYICNSIQPSIMKPFFKNSLNHAINAMNFDSSILNQFVNNAKELLEKEDFQEVNRNVLSEILIEKIEETPVTNKEFDELIKCVPLLSLKYVKPLISPKLWQETTSDKLKRAIIISLGLSKTPNESPLSFFNEIINSVAQEQMEKEFLLKNISNAIESFKEHKSLPNWFLELLGQTQLELIDSHVFSASVAFMCDVLVTVVVTVSDHKVFHKVDNDHADSIRRLLPQAFVFLLKESNWNNYTTQILEWLHYMVNYKTTPEKFKNVFYQTLVSLRHESEFKVSLKWLKYVSCRID